MVSDSLNKDNEEPKQKNGKIILQIVIEQKLIDRFLQVTVH